MLTFVDLVAHLALENLGLIFLNKNDKNFGDTLIGDNDNFKFVLFASFSKMSESIAVDLCESLYNYCKQNGYKNFKYVLRLSQENLNPDRWDETFISNQINKYDNRIIRRIWVCGPPAMSETFEKAFL